MASIPSKGDRLIAKVELTVFQNKECTVSYPILPPGPHGLRKSTQFPGVRKASEEVGAYTGGSSEWGYETDYVLRYSVAEYLPFKFKWVTHDIMKLIKVWVKKDQVTGFWDKGVDAPKVPENNNTPPPAADNTNLYLIIALAVAIFLKFVRPNLKR